MLKYLGNTGESDFKALKNSRATENFRGK